MKTELKTTFQNTEFKTIAGSQTVTFGNDSFVVDDKITSSDQLEKEVIEFLAIENINHLLIDLLENKGLDDILEVDLYDFIDQLEFNSYGYREYYILACMYDVELYSDNYLKIIDDVDNFIIVDLKGKLRS